MRRTKTRLGSSKQTARSAKAQGIRGRKPEKARDNGGAQRERKNKKEKKQNGAQSGSEENSETQQGGGGGSNHRRAAKGQTGTTKEATAHEEPRSGRPTKKTAHSAKAQGTRGPKTSESGGQRARATRKKKGAQSGSEKNNDTQKRGGGGSNHQRAANGEAGNTKEGRAHEEPRSGRPTKKQHTAPRPRAKEGPYQDRPPLCPFRL